MHPRTSCSTQSAWWTLFNVLFSSYSTVQKERDTLMASFIKPNMYTSNNFVNSPDSVLRNMARVAQSIIEKNGIEEKL